MNENFIFYGSWKDTIDGYEESLGREAANEFARQIINFGVTGEMTTDNKMMVGIINGMCKDLIEKSRKRYETGSKYGKLGGRPAQYDHQAIRQMHQEGYSYSQIAEKFGCAIRTVQRALEKEEEI